MKSWHGKEKLTKHGVDISSDYSERFVLTIAIIRNLSLCGVVLLEVYG